MQSFRGRKHNEEINMNTRMSSPPKVENSVVYMR